MIVVIAFVMLSHRSVDDYDIEAFFVNNHASLREFSNGNVFIETLNLETLPGLDAHFLVVKVKMYYGKPKDSHYEFWNWHYLIKNQKIYRLGGISGMDSYVLINDEVGLVNGEISKNSSLIYAFSSGFGVISSQIVIVKANQDSVSETLLSFLFFRGECRLEKLTEKAIAVYDIDTNHYLGKLEMGKTTDEWGFSKNKDLPWDIAERVRWEID